MPARCLFIALIIYANCCAYREKDAEPLDPVCELLAKNQPGRYRTTYDDSRLPHDARPHHALGRQALHEERDDDHVCQKAQGQVVMPALLREPFEVGVSEQFGGRHDEDVNEAHAFVNSWD